MQQISIDFDVFKELTARRVHEQHTYNDVLRELLELDSVVEPASAADILLEGETKNLRGIGAGILGPSGFSSRELFLPNGTVLKATYKQRLYSAKIENGNWINPSGKKHTSPSAAAREITGSMVNGLRFWHAKRPSDELWYRLDIIR